MSFDSLCIHISPLSSHSSKLMSQCWRKDSEERSTFSQLSAIVEKRLASIAELGMVLMNPTEEVEQLGKCINRLKLVG